MKRFFALLPLITLAGCEQMRPPTAEGLKVMAARTATGTKNTKLETKTQPSPPRAGQISIWDIKVFDIKDKPDKTRQEWKFFNALPQSSNDKSTTEVLMNAWLISKDRSVFLPQKPLYKQYGSFLTDWTVPRNGPYTLWVEYQPVKAKPELSFEDLKKAPALEVEHARWDLTIAGSADTVGLKPQAQGKSKWTVFSLDATNYGEKSPVILLFTPTSTRTNADSVLRWNAGASSEVSDEAVTALSPDNQVLLHGVGKSPELTFTQKGLWRLWFSFLLEGKRYAAPVDLSVT